jgi:UrcA family protein
MIRTAIIAAVTACTFFAAAPAQAAQTQATIDPYRDRPTIVVKIADLDLAHERDQEIMVRRVERAARRICDSEVTLRERRKCARETVEYTLNLVPPHIRRAYAAASDRRGSFALAQN